MHKQKNAGIKDKWGLFRTLHQVRLQLGERAEQVADNLFTNPPCNCELPDWYFGHRMVDRGSDEDMCGIDMVIQTKYGPLRVQIKSSKRNKEAFEFVRDHDSRFVEKHSKLMPICAIVINVAMDPKDIFPEVMNEIEEHFSIYAK